MIVRVENEYGHPRSWEKVWEAPEETLGTYKRINGRWYKRMVKYMEPSNDSLNDFLDAVREFASGLDDTKVGIDHDSYDNDGCSYHIEITGWRDATYYEVEWVLKKIERTEAVKKAQEQTQIAEAKRVLRENGLTFGRDEW